MIPATTHILASTQSFGAKMKYGTRDQYGNINIWESDKTDLLEVTLDIDNYWASIQSNQKVVTILTLIIDNG